MNKLELLARRRELVVLTAKLQRASIRARLDRLQSNPRQALFDFAAQQLRRPSVRTALLIALADVLAKIWRHRRAGR